MRYSIALVYVHISGKANSRKLNILVILETEVTRSYKTILIVIDWIFSIELNKKDTPYEKQFSILKKYMRRNRVSMIARNKSFLPIRPSYGADGHARQAR